MALYNGFGPQEKLSIDEQRKRLAYWALTGDDSPQHPETMPEWEKLLYMRICGAMRKYGKLVIEQKEQNK